MTAGRPDHAAPGEAGAGAGEPEPMRVVSGRLVSLQFVKGALRRRRGVWLGAALLGLLIGAGYHLVVPMKYPATAIVYLGHPASGGTTAEAQDDLAMLNTAAVADRALARLGDPGTTAAGLLGKAPGTLASDSVLIITIDGPTPHQAVRRVDAVAGAYLAYRSQQYDAQNTGVERAADRQVASLEAKIATLSTRIAALGTSTPGTASVLESERASATAEVTALHGSVQQDELNAISVAQGSRILSPGTLVHVSTVRVMGVDGLTGLVAGLGAGLLLVVVGAVLSDRLRRREDLAELLGAPVELSITRRRRGRRRPGGSRSILARAARPDPGLQALEHYLRGRLTVRGLPSSLLVVAADDPEVPAMALIALGATFAAATRRVVLVDATAGRVVGRAFGTTEVGFRPVHRHPFPALTLLVAPTPWETDEDERWRYSLGALPDVDVILVLATVDPSVGARHLESWGRQAVVTVTAGRSSAPQVGTVRELVEDAGVAVAAAVLLDADASDDSVGLPAREEEHRAADEPADRSTAATVLAT